MNSDIFGVTEITSKTNSTIVKIGKLNSKKYRNIEKLFLCQKNKNKGVLWYKKLPEKQFPGS